MLEHVSEHPSFLQLNPASWPAYATFCLFHPSVDNLGGFHLLVVVNNATANLGVHILFKESAFNYLGYIPRSRIARYSGHSVFNLLRNCLIVSHGGWAI